MTKCGMDNKIQSKCRFVWGMWATHRDGWSRAAVLISTQQCRSVDGQWQWRRMETPRMEHPRDPTGFSLGCCCRSVPGSAEGFCAGPGSAASPPGASPAKQRDTLVWDSGLSRGLAASDGTLWQNPTGTFEQLLHYTLPVQKLTGEYHIHAVRKMLSLPKDMQLFLFFFSKRFLMQHLISFLFIYLFRILLSVQTTSLFFSFRKNSHFSSLLVILKMEIISLGQIRWLEILLMLQQKYQLLKTNRKSLEIL